MNKEKIKNDILASLNAANTTPKFKYQFIGETETSDKDTFQLDFTIGSGENFGIIVSNVNGEKIHLEVCITSLTSYFNELNNLNRLQSILKVVTDYVNTYNLWFKLPNPKSIFFVDATLVIGFDNTTDFELAIPYFEEYENTENTKEIKIYESENGYSLEIFFGDNRNPIKLDYLKADRILKSGLVDFKDEEINLTFKSSTHTVEFIPKYDLIVYVDEPPVFYDEGELPPVL